MEAVKRQTLYDFAQEHREIMDILFQTEGELTPELEARLDANLRGGSDKLDAAAAVWRRLIADSEIATAESSRLAERASQSKRDADNLRARMLMVIDENFSGKLTTPTNKMWGQTSAPTIAVVLAPDADLNDVAKHDPTIVRTTLALDKAEIQRRIKAGEPIPPEVTTEEKPGTRYLRIK